MPKEILKSKLLRYFLSMNKDLSVEKKNLVCFLDDNIDAIYTFIQHLEPFSDDHQEDIFWRDTLNVELFIQCVQNSKEFNESVKTLTHRHSCKNP